MTIQIPKYRRIDGKEQPFIPAGPFKIRIPFVHWGVEMTEVLQAMVMFTVGMAATVALQDVFGMPFEVALTIVIFHEMTYCLHQVFGDPIIPGWITPALPLVVSFLTQYGMGIERVEHLIALQIMVGFLFLILGLSGIAKELLHIIPRAMQSGIVLGAGIAALTGKWCFAKGGSGIFAHPWSISLGVLFAFYLIFSKHFGGKIHNREEGVKSFMVRIAQFGIVPGIVLGIIVGWITGELPLPQMQSGLFFKPHIKEVITNYSIFGVGIPPLMTWVHVIPMALVAYIIAFGDVIVGYQVMKDANEFRKDEVIDADPNRLNLLCALRNFLEGCIMPTVTLAGPVWAAMTVAVTERYKLGRKAMDSIFGGSGSFNFMKFASCLILPLVCIFKPALPVALSLTLMIQGFACAYIAMRLVHTNSERGVAGVTGGALAAGGPLVGLAVGLVLSFVLLGKEAFTEKEAE
jgi:hypothetical protein